MRKPLSPEPVAPRSADTADAAASAGATDAAGSTTPTCPPGPKTATPVVRLSDFISEIARSPLARWQHLDPWQLTSQADAIVRELLAARVNLEAGAVVCNHRNERSDRVVQVRIGDALHRTGCDKFGAVIGDGARVGANAVIAPGALLAPDAVVPRASLRDDEAPRR